MEVVLLIAPEEAIARAMALMDEEEETPQERLTPLEVMEILEVDPQWIVRETGLRNNAVMRALMGGSKRIHEETALLIAGVLGVRVDELDWPNELTHVGRPPLSRNKTTASPVSTIDYEPCREHFLVRPGGKCSYCA